MNGSDIRSIARQQLSEAIAKSEPATCDPLNVSPWIAMSAFQKSVRRGKSAWHCERQQRFCTYHLSAFGGDAAASHSKISASPIATRSP